MSVFSDARWPLLEVCPIHIPNQQMAIRLAAAGKPPLKRPNNIIPGPGIPVILPKLPFVEIVTVVVVFVAVLVTVVPEALVPAEPAMAAPV